jgi:hypothetical protein
MLSLALAPNLAHFHATIGKVATCQHREKKDQDRGKEVIPYEAV